MRAPLTSGDPSQKPAIGTFLYAPSIPLSTASLSASHYNKLFKLAIMPSHFNEKYCSPNSTVESLQSAARFRQSTYTIG